MYIYTRTHIHIYIYIYIYVYVEREREREIQTTITLNHITRCMLHVIVPLAIFYPPLKYIGGCVWLFYKLRREILISRNWLEG